jgi:hypothetical protein
MLLAYAKVLEILERGERREGIERERGQLQWLTTLCQSARRNHFTSVAGNKHHLDYPHS